MAYPNVCQLFNLKYLNMQQLTPQERNQIIDEIINGLYEADPFVEIIVPQTPLESLKQQEAELLKQLSENRDKQRKIKLAEMEKEFGISVGDVIEYNGKKGIVSRIDADRTYPVYYLPFKANGKPAMREVWCYGFERIKLIEKCQPTT